MKQTTFLRGFLTQGRVLATVVASLTRPGSGEPHAADPITKISDLKI